MRFTIFRARHLVVRIGHRHRVRKNEGGHKTARLEYKQCFRLKAIHIILSETFSEENEHQS